MSLFFANKMVRFLLALSVSIWMAGGCLFGCSNSVMAAESVAPSVPTTEAGESCHAVQSHHCCAPTKAKPQVVSTARQTVGLPSFVPVPDDVMKDCPLMVNATAAASKSNTNMPDPGHVPVTVLPSLGNQTAPVDNISVVLFLPNRGPTHLRCCVFLI